MRGRDPNRVRRGVLTGHGRREHLRGRVRHAKLDGQGVPGGRVGEVERVPRRRLLRVLLRLDEVVHEGITPIPDRTNGVEADDVDHLLQVALLPGG